MPRDSTRSASISRRTLTKAVGGAAASLGVAGCIGQGSNDQGTSSSGGTNESAATSEGTSNSQYNMKYWSWTVVVPTMQQAVQQYNEETKHKVDVVKKDPGSVPDLLVTAMRSKNNLPDVSQIFGSMQRQGALQGGYTQMPELKDIEDDFAPVAKSLHGVYMDDELKWFGMPQTKGGHHLTYNRKLFKEAGLPTDPIEVGEEIQTWKQFVEAGKKVEKETGAKMLALDLTGAENTLGVNLPVQAGGKWYNWDGEFQFDMERNRIALETLHSLKQVSTQARRNTGKFWDLLKNDKVATIPGASWVLAYTTQYAPETAGKWRIAQPPVMEEIDNCVRGGYHHGGMGIVPTALEEEYSKDRHQAAVDMVQRVNKYKAGFEGKLDNLYCGQYMPKSHRTDKDILNKTYEFTGDQKRNKWLINSVWIAPKTHNAPNTDVSDFAAEAKRQIMKNDKPIGETLSKYQEKMMGTLDENQKQLNDGKGADGVSYPGHNNKSMFK